MNKKLFLGMFAAVGMLLATSCQNDELDAVQSGNEATVSFTIKADGGVQTRAFSDGSGVDELIYSIYDANGNLLTALEDEAGNKISQKKETGLTDLKSESGHEVKFTLAKGQVYYVAFWAQNSGCEVYNTDNLRSVTVDYDGDNNDDVRDAFFKTERIEVFGNNQSYNITLKRPFAQLNVGVYQSDWDDAEASGIEMNESMVEITNAASTIDLLTGATSEPKKVTYALATIPCQKNEVLSIKKADGSVETYKWLSMSYFLVNDESADGTAKMNLTDVKFTFKPISGEPYVLDNLTNVPVRRNWRTNILGKLLTGDVQINVRIDEMFAGDINNGIEEIAAGISYNKDANEFLVSSADGLDWLSKTVNGTITRHELVKNEADRGWFFGQTITLTADIDMEGKNWTPISLGWPARFAGNFDGGNFTIKNLKIDAADTGNVGLFGEVAAGASVKNVKLVDVDILGNSSVAGIAGTCNSAIIENCHIEGGSITGNDEGNVGAIVGLLSEEGGETYVKDCSVKNLTVNGKSRVGGVVGCTNVGAAVISGNEVVNVTVILDQTEVTDDSNSGAEAVLGYIYPDHNPNPTLDENVTSGVKIEILKKNQDGVLEISTAEAFVYANENLFKKTDVSILLKEDIDMSNVSDYTPSELGDNFSFDGGGKTISNWSTVATTTQTDARGLFASRIGNKTITIKNLTLKDCTVTTSGTGNESSVGLLIGWFEGHLENNKCVLSDIKVNGGELSSNRYAAGLVGYFNGAELDIKNCEVDAVTIRSAGGSVGGILGHGGGTSHKISGCTVENSTIQGEENNKIGYLVGTFNAGNTVISSCSGTNNKYGDAEELKHMVGRFLNKENGASLTIDGTSQENFNHTER